MGEDGDNQLDTGPIKGDISRRKAITGGLALAGSIVLTRNWVGKEIVRDKNGIETEYGVFLPLYESHDVGISLGDLPSNLDYFVLEMSEKSFLSQPGESDYRSDENIISVLLTNPMYTTTNNSKVYQSLIDNNVPFMFTDIGTPSLELSLTYPNWSIRKIEAIAGSPLLLNEKLHRRAVIKGLVLWLSTPYIVDVLSTPLYKNPNKDVLKRIATRMDGMMSHSHPEHAIVFLRNLITASKLAYMAQLDTEAGHKPRIAYNFGAAHSGIEDLLQAGPEITNKLLSIYPRKYLERFITFNGGIDHVARIRVVHPHPVADPEKQFTTDVRLKNTLESLLQDVK